MDGFSAALDALQKQSKEQIMSTQVALQHACSEGVSPARIAITIGNRFTAGQVATSFPVICLLDAMTTKTEEVHVLSALEEFLEIAPSIFTNYADTDEVLRDKVSRVIKRWEGRKGVSKALCNELLDAIAGKKRNKDQNIKNTVEHQITEGEANSSVQALTSLEASSFCAILQNCAKIIEHLPPDRANAYIDLIKKEKKYRKPSKDALLFFQRLHVELSGENSSHSNNPNKSEPSITDVSFGSGSDKKVALENLLEKLSTEQASSSSVAARDHSFHIVRYTSPLQSDICQRLPVVQRNGFGDWQRRVKSEYHHPKKESGVKRVFRNSAGSQAAETFRSWFPTEQQWINENDMAILTLYNTKEAAGERKSSNVYEVVRKRSRDS